MSGLPVALRWLLLGSLSLNLLLAATLLAWAWRAPAAPEQAITESARDLRDPGPPRRWERVLGPERRDLVRASLGPEREALREAARAAQAARMEVAATLRAQPFEPTRLDAALAEQRAREQAVAERVHAGLRRLAEQLEPEERQRLAERVAERRPGGRRNRD